MTPTEAACKIDRLYSPHGLVLDEDIIDILTEVAATAKSDAFNSMADDFEVFAMQAETEARTRHLADAAEYLRSQAEAEAAP